MQTQNGQVYSSEGPQKVWNPIFIRIFIVNVTMQMGQFMMNTLIPKYAKHLGASVSVVGIVTSMFAITALSMRIFAGPATMTFSKKKILAAASMVIASAFGLYGLSASIPMVMVARLLHGCGMGFSGSTALALASDALPHDKLGAGIGFFSLGQAIATAVGPSVGLTLVPKIGYSMTFFIGASVVVFAAFMLLTIKAPDIAAKVPFKISLNTIFAKEAAIPMLLILFLTIGYNNISAFLVLFAESRNVGNIGLFFSVYAVVMLVTRPVVAVLSDRLGVRKIMLPAMICFAVSMVLISLSTSLTMFLIAAAIAAIGFGSCQPAVQTLCIKSVTPQRRGVGSSTNFVGLDLGGLVGPVLAGAVADRFGYATMFLLLTVPIGIAIAIFCLFYGRIKAIDTQTTVGSASNSKENNHS